MVNISIGKSLKINFGDKKKETVSPPPAKTEPVQRRCSVCGNYTTTTSDRCPKCQSKL